MDKQAEKHFAAGEGQPLENPYFFRENIENFFVFPCKEWVPMVNYKRCKTVTQFSDTPTIT